MSNRAKDPWVFGAKDSRHRGVEVQQGENLLTVTEAIKQGDLDWMVEMREFESADDDRITGEGHRMTVKVEDVIEDGQPTKSYHKLGIVQGRYTLLQNRAAFAFFDRTTWKTPFEFGSVRIVLASTDENFSRRRIKHHTKNVNLK